jgi:hypothetical protein
MTYGFVLGGIGLHLGAIKRHMAQAHHPGLLTQSEDLNEQTLKGIKVTAVEVADSAVIGLLIAGQYPESKVLVTSPLDLPGRDGAHAVRVKQHRHHPWIESLLPTWIFSLSGDQDGRKIQLIHQIQQEIHLVVF